MRADVILPAAGISERMNLPIAKQFLTVLGKHILAYTVDSFHRFPWIRHIVIVVSASQIEFTRQLLKSYGFSRVLVCAGSNTRHRSIFCGLKALESECSGNDVVIVHDAARPFVPEQVAKQVAEAAAAHGAAGVTRPLVSTVIRAGEDGLLVESLDRRLFSNSEMPQSFRYGVITSAYEKCSEDDLDHGTECLLLAMKYSQCRAALVEGTDDLWKVTYQKDVYSMESIVKEKFMVVSIFHNNLELLALTEFQSRLHLQRIKALPTSARIPSTLEGLNSVHELRSTGEDPKVTDSVDIPANTFVVLWDLQTSNSTFEDLAETAKKISNLYKLDMPNSVVRLDLMVVIILLHRPLPQANTQPREQESSLEAVCGSIFQSQPESLDAKLSLSHDSPCGKPSRKDNIMSAAGLSQLPLDHAFKVSFTNTGLSVATSYESNNILYPTPVTQRDSTEYPSTGLCLSEFENSLVQSLVSLRLSTFDSYEEHPKLDVARRSFIICRAVVQTMKEKLQKETDGKSAAVVVGVSCQAESNIGEQLVELIWQRSSYIDGQILIF